MARYSTPRHMPKGSSYYREFCTAMFIIILFYNNKETDDKNIWMESVTVLCTQ